MERQIDRKSEQPTLPTKGESPRMFDRIAHRYDLINRVLTFRMDVGWRRALGRQFPDRPDLAVLDVATGTGDVLLFALQRHRNIGLAVGIDVAPRMMQIGVDKARRDDMAERVQFVQGDALALPFADNSFDVVTISFGIRNVTDVPRALGEMRRVLKPDGRALILEFSFPKNRLLRSSYLAYLRHVLPRVGGLLSGDAIPYQYLDKTVEGFPFGDRFCRIMTESGFAEVRQKPLTFGIATVYSGAKK